MLLGNRQQDLKKPRPMTSSEKIDLGIKAVRHCGKTNMFDKKAVQYWAFQMGFFELVNFIEDANGGEYIQRANNVYFDLLPDVDSTELLELEDNFEARQMLEEDYFFMQLK